MSYRSKIRTALDDALNGDAGTVPPPVKRGLTLLAVATDEVEERRAEFERRIEEKVDEVVATVDGLKRLVAGTGATVVMTIVAAAAAVITRL